MPGFYFSLSVPTVGPIFLHIEECHSLYNLGEASNMYALMYCFLPSWVVHLYHSLVLFSVTSSGWSYVVVSFHCGRGEQDRVWWVCRKLDSWKWWCQCLDWGGQAWATLSYGLCWIWEERANAAKEWATAAVWSQKWEVAFLPTTCREDPHSSQSHPDDVSDDARPAALYANDSKWMKPAANHTYYRYGWSSHMSGGRASQVSDQCANNRMWGWA